MKFIGKVEFSLISILTALLMQFSIANAQVKYKITGSIIDENDQPISYATVAMINNVDSSVIEGTVSNENGNFEIANNKLGRYIISVSFIGYLSAKTPIDIQAYKSIDLGKIILHPKVTELNEAVVRKERVKTKQTLDHTTYFVNKKMQKASNTGIDMIKFVPGVQVDLFHNISFEGSKNVLIQVNGIERGSDFLNQLNSNLIDKIEISNNTSGKHSSDISGVLNIILKKEKNNGLSGHVYAEIPIRSNEVYSFPSASFNYIYNKLNFYSSYNGEFSSFDIESHNDKNIKIPNHRKEILKTQFVKQRNWSHKFNFGFDYILNDRTQLGFYSFINPYSNEHDGLVKIKEKTGISPNRSWESSKEDKDKNLSMLASVYYKHQFNKRAKEMTFYINYFSLNVENRIILSDFNSDQTLNHILKPTIHDYHAQLDFNIPLKSGFSFKIGLSNRLNILGDKGLISFSYRKNISSTYASLSYSKNSFHISGGMRVEYEDLESGESINDEIFSCLPNINLKYDISKKSSLKFHYKKSIQRPGVYDLNPNINPVDPYTRRRGNLLLQPAIHQEFALDYSVSLNNNFISIGTFYKRSSNVIENTIVLNDLHFFDISTENLGKIKYYGIKLLGSLKLHKNVTFNPVIKGFKIKTYTNKLAQNIGLENKNSFAFESGFSVAASFKHDLTLSAMLKYNSSIAKIQSKYFEDPLYLISLDKSVLKKFKIGLTCAIPFKKAFNSQGYKSSSPDFSMNFKENIIFSVLPVWFKVKYSFASGKKIKRTKSLIKFDRNKQQRGL
ncbi:TonB-dependent receptor [Ancylomarina sp. DW003]|nr:TonB-dependent receptor [Ancylomarina sp. DW003]MDE5422570.1 TonB-dependent receptor [Ancylomarina sp. DW003]